MNAAQTDNEGQRQQAGGLVSASAGKWTKGFILCSGAILLVTGVAKAVSAVGSSEALKMSDPVLGISFRQLLVLAGIAELAVGTICLFMAKQNLCLSLIAWLATSLTAYRAGLWSLGWHHPCPCLGSLMAALHLAPQTADTAMKVVLAGLLIGSYLGLFCPWKRPYA